MSIDETTRTPSTQQTSPRSALTLAVLGAVCSAVATAVLDRLDVSDTGKLVGLAAGAALPRCRPSWPWPAGGRTSGPRPRWC